MSFLHPMLAGAGAAAVAIPILIHLLMRRRRRPIDFGAMRFLLEAMRQQRRRLRLEQLLLLLTRCAVVALIALGLAQPLLGSAPLLGAGASVTVYLLVDNSLTSQATGDGESDLARSQRIAGALLDTLSGRDARAGLITLANPAEAVVAPASSDIGAVRQLVGQLAPTDAAADLPGALAALTDAIEGEDGEVVVALLSGMRAGSVDLDRSPPQLGGQLTFLASLPATEPVTNLAVTGIEPLRAALIAGEGPAQQPGVRIEVARSGADAPASASVRLRALAGPSGPVAEGTIRFDRGQLRSSVIVRPATPQDLSGWLTLRAELDADAIAGDNTARRPIPVRAGLRIGLITARRFGAERGLDTDDPASWVRLALRPGAPLLEPGDEDFGDLALATIDPEAIDAARLASLDGAIVLRPDQLSELAWQRLRSFADGGGLVVIFPPATGASTWADQMLGAMEAPLTISREGRSLEPALGVATQPGADDMGLLTLLAGELEELAPPVTVSRALEITIDEPGPQAPLTLTDGSPLLVGFRPGAGDEAGRGLVVVMAVALAADWTDLPARPLIVPLLQEIVRQGVGRAAGAGAWPAGARPPVPARTISLRRAGEEGPDIPVDETGRPAVPLRRAGLLEAIDDRGRIGALVAINADTAGSDVQAQPARAVGAWLSGGDIEPVWIGADEGEIEGVPGAQAAGAVLSPDEESSSIALPLLIGAAALAVLEMLLARLFSHASAQRGPGVLGRLRGRMAPAS
ncbi:MAG: BatA domain-containing protein [Phycisphaerales bacterium JB039]